ncbi:hypothetical protein BDZ94DRAFT_1255577 [Collybia nuda]|uniref:Uncharacterized protein n=1 Tax=Collybia nuda TaxID=64659 RepID=A0A9P5Y7D2_9AGAR|nr:hypothetical protein BDZ94DRAFT_1255577 [Collybia nuda]
MVKRLKIFTIEFNPSQCIFYPDLSQASTKRSNFYPDARLTHFAQFCPILIRMLLGDFKKFCQFLSG